MKVLIEKSFQKDVEKISEQSIKRRVAAIIEKVIEAEKISEIPNCKKMKGHNSAFRIRLGSYKIGFFMKAKQ